MASVDDLREVIRVLKQHALLWEARRVEEAIDQLAKAREEARRG